jgi:ADP-heptose:LPS heptosyltransferase
MLGYDNAIVLLPGAGKPNKLWPVERFRELAKRIGPKALAVWGPGERELAEAIGARVAPPTNLRELAGILQNAEVVIGGDTGPLHLADALGTKVIGLYGRPIRAATARITSCNIASTAFRLDEMDGIDKC